MSKSRQAVLKKYTTAAGTPASTEKPRRCEWRTMAAARLEAQAPECA
ncbi:hypothetical protein COLINT_03181 [Collinsella intestinalis DSM 13280]|uniref:Uncharacterized protein n=1 Tax=Collinsella intestinalis DSM 13280 TaxID=521003 RepID=C4FAT5_9ACTN|nr:hypothetical protein COLINT_03181 [Collinsella intestinalis DSM 13280]